MFSALNYIRSNGISRPRRVDGQTKGSFYALMKVSSWTPQLVIFKRQLTFQAQNERIQRKTIFRQVDEIIL